METIRTQVIALTRKKLLEFFQSTQGEKTIQFEDFAREVRREVIDLDLKPRLGRTRITTRVVYTQEELDKDTATVNGVLELIRLNIFGDAAVIESYQILSIATPKDYTRKSGTPQVPAVKSGNGATDGDYAVSGSGGWSVLNATRDELGWNGSGARTGFWKKHLSTPGNRFIALDFNDAESTSARGIEIAVPSNVTSDERALCKLWAKKTRQLYIDNKLEEKSPKSLIIRNGGILVGVGISGVFHTEPFFAHDKEARNVIGQNAREYAQILVSTLGQIKGATFIAPHETNTGGGGADAPLDSGSGAGLNERDFAKNFIIPQIIDLATGK
jgi:hypothetical protein